MHVTWARRRSGETNSWLTATKVRENMSLMKTEVSCNKFQANVFDQGRCQNCYKSRELHLMTRVELEQVKPIYASWLCLAPEGLDFDNPMQRSRKWQRRFFILYEHGCLEFALDDLPSTIPQGTVNLHHCSDVTEAEDQTGQKNTLCIITPDQDIYIRGDSKEIINGWCEQLLLFRQTNKQRQRKRERRSSVPLQEKTSTLKSVCNIGAANTEAVEDGDMCTAGVEDDPHENTEDINTGQDVKVNTADANSLGSDKWAKEGTGMLRTLEIKQETSNMDTHQAERGWQGEDAESCAKHPEASSLAKHLTDNEENTEKPKAGTQQNKNDNDSSFIKSSVTRGVCWTNENEKRCKMCTQCTTSSRSHTGCIQNMAKSVGLKESPQSNSSTVTRLQIMQVKRSESTMTPDLLNFKKGWLFMDDCDQWRRYWFVLSAHSLRYYFDSGAEEASQLIGEIDLTTCHRVTELQGLEKFGFEIWTHRMVYKLATETAGMRQNWIQALTKNLQDQNAPDVASIPDNWPSRLGPQSGPDVTQESMSVSCPVNEECLTERSPLHYRKQQGHPKTSSWTDMLTQEGLIREEEKVEQNAEGKINKRRGREERRQKYAIMMSSSVSPLDEKNSCTEENQQQERMSEIEQRWLQVEKMAIREEKRVPLYPVCQSEDYVENLLEHYRKRLEKVTIQSESTNQDNSQYHGHGTDWSLLQKPTCDLGTERESQKIGPDKQNTSLTAKYQYTLGLVNLEDLKRRQINDLYPSSPSSTEVTNEPKRTSELNLLHEEITFAKPIKSLRSLALCQASRNVGDDPFWAGIFSERTSQVMNKDTNSDQAMLKLFSLKAKFLIRQNQTLNQRNQELLSQLAEADREINRLKAKLFYHPHGHQPELETIVECLKLELARCCSELQEAKTQLAEMEDILKDTQQLKEAVLRGLGMESENKNAFPKIIDRLGQCVRVLEFKVSELLSQQRLSTLTCKDPQTQNNLLVKLEVENGQKVIEDGKKNKLMQTELESNFPFCEALTHIKDQQHPNKTKIVEQLKKRSNVLSFLQEVINQLAGNEMTDSVSKHEAVQMNPRVFRRLQLENDIWESFLNTLKNTVSNNMENEEMACVLQIAEMKLEEVKTYLSALSIYEGTSSNPLAPSSNSRPNSSDNTSSTNPDIVSKNDGKIVEEQMDVMWKCLKEHMEQRMILIDHVTSKFESVTKNEHVSEIMKQSYIWNKTNTFYLMVSVVMDIVAGYLVEKLSQPVQKIEVSEGGGKETITSLKNHIKELEDLLSERLTSLQQQFDKDKERLKTAFKQEITLLKESHRNATEVFLLKHQREQDLLQEEKERLLTEEVAACLTVIKAMKRAHRSELEKMQQKALQERTYIGDVNIEVILKNHSEELSAVQRELDALSEQYTQKCLENVHLAEALQTKRKTLQQYQCQNQAFNVYNQGLNNHLAKEIRRLSTVAKDGCSQLVHDREEYERMIILQVKESCQAQEIDILKNELCAAKMDQKIATERFHEIQTELNSVIRTTEQQITQLKENLRLVYGALEESIKKMMPTTPLISSSQPALC